MSTSFSRFVIFSYMIVLVWYYPPSSMSIIRRFGHFMIFQNDPLFCSHFKKSSILGWRYGLAVKSTGCWSMIQTVKNKNLEMINGDLISTKQGGDIQTHSNRHPSPLSTRSFSRLIWGMSCFLMNTWDHFNHH